MSGAWLPGPAWLFCPADRPERYPKALDRADLVILDLEDAVAPADKAGARAAVAAAGIDPDRTVVRINAAGTPEHALDLELLDRIGCRRVMLAKAERAADVEALAPREVFVLVESPIGVQRVDDITGPANVAGVMWGADDLVAGLGGTASRHPDGRYRDVARYARSRALIAAKARGVLALDSVFMDLTDADGLRAECEDAVAVGFDVKVAIHPGQVDVIRSAYAPSPERLDWARRLLAAAGDRRGVFTFEGRMVDGPIFRQAERLLAYSSSSSSG